MAIAFLWVYGRMWTVFLPNGLSWGPDNWKAVKINFVSCKHEISHTNYFNSLYCDWYCEKEHYTSYAFYEVIFMMLMTFKEDGFPKNLETKSGRTMTRIQMSSTITARGWENIFREFVFSSTKRCLPWLNSISEKL